MGCELMYVLVVNCGSSSLKYELFDTTAGESMAKGLIERIGDEAAPASVHHKPECAAGVNYETDIPDHTRAVAEMTKLLTEGAGRVIESMDEVHAIGHRVVHGGEDFSSSSLVTDEVIAAIERNAALAPLHNPPNLAGIRACQAVMPGKRNVAVFDTAFHQTMPRHAYLYAIPREYYEEHRIRRYGFHGTSHYYVARRAVELLRAMGRDGDRARVVTCHLGNGCSMAAVVGGKCVDTTMGLTPLEGCVMGTRCGDIDPAIVPFLGLKFDLSYAEIDRQLNKASGLLGLSRISNDMRDVLAAAEDGDRNAGDAFLVFCYRVKKYIGAYAAAMGGLDAIVFTAGIGENSVAVREKVLDGLEFLGIRPDPARQLGCGDRPITDPSAPCVAFVIGTKEELVIAEETVRICNST